MFPLKFKYDIRFFPLAKFQRNEKQIYQYRIDIKDLIYSSMWIHAKNNLERSEFFLINSEIISKLNLIINIRNKNKYPHGIFNTFSPSDAKL